LTIVCRFQEVSNFLYTQNTFEFNHLMSLMIFKKTVHPPLLNCIKYISINLQRDPYNPGRPTQAFKFLRLDVWPEMWDIIAGMEGLEVIRVRFQFPLKGWLGWGEKKVLEPLWNVTRPMRVSKSILEQRLASGMRILRPHPSSCWGMKSE
jgi:hypothetical protein